MLALSAFFSGAEIAFVSANRLRVEVQARRDENVGGVVKGFLESKLPDAVKGPVMGALTGENVESAADAVKGALGGFLGGD